MLIDNLLDTFNIERSLGAKGLLMIMWWRKQHLKSSKQNLISIRMVNYFEKLERELFDYVNWYNNFRIHGSLGYLNPVEYKQLYIYNLY